MGSLSVRLDKSTEEMLKQLLSSRKMKASDLIREMIEKEAAGGLTETVNSMSLAVDVIQDRMAGIEAILGKTMQEAAFGAYLWRLAQAKKTPEEIVAVQAGYEEYLQKLMMEA